MAPKTKQAKEAKPKRKRQRRPRARRGNALAQTAVAKKLPKIQRVGDMLVKRMAVCMMLPGPDTAIRFPTVEMEKTTVRGFRQLQDIVSPTTAAPGFTTGDLLVAFTGQPGLLYQYWRDAKATTYTGLWSTEAVASNTSIPSTSITLFDVGLNTGNSLFGAFLGTTPWPVPLPFAGLYSSTAGFHGTFLPVAHIADSPETFVYLNGGDTLTITFTWTMDGSGWGGVLVCDVMQWDGATKGATPLITNAMLNGVSTETAAGIPSSSGMSVLTFTVNAPAWYKVSIVSLRTSAAPASGVIRALSATYTITAGSTAGWSLVSSPQLVGPSVPNSTGIPAIGEKAKINGVSILMTNTTNLLNRGGTITAARIAPGELNPETVGPEQLGGISNDLYNGDGAKGVYTFMENTVYKASYRDFTNKVGPMYCLDDDSKFHFMRLNSSTAQTLAVTTSYVLEYKCSNQLLCNDSVAAGNTTLVEQARGLVNSEPEWFFENPLHMSQIFSWIKSMGRGLLKIGPTAFGGAAAATGNPALAGVATILSGMNKMFL